MPLRPHCRHGFREVVAGVGLQPLLDHSLWGYRFRRLSLGHPVEMFFEVGAAIRGRLTQFNESTAPDLDQG